MVTVTLKIQSYCDQNPVDARLRTFDSLPITIGRSTSCTYHLPDESRYVSANHALITWEDDTLCIYDTSANGLYINGESEPIGRGRKIILRTSDSLILGDYTLAVQVSEGPAAVAPDDPLADFGLAQSDDATPAAFDIDESDDDWNPPSRDLDDPFGDWLPEDTSADAPISALNSTTQNDEDEDWFPDLTPDVPAQTPVEAHEIATAVHDDFDWLPAMDDETVSRQTSAENLSEFPQRQPELSASTSPDARRALAILLEAAGVQSSEIASDSDEAILEQAGQILAISVDAMMKLLQSRAEMKNAIRANMTTIVQRNNNPLKFSDNASIALGKLLSREDSGTMDANQAIHETVDDLKLHQVALLEGMKAAVKSILLQFNPDKLSRKLEKSGGIAANIPVTREAKLWKLFCAQYDAIHEEAISDFDELFGAEFRKAYEMRVRQQGRTPDF